MAYCDAKTMDPRTNLLAVDEVFPTVANEVYQVLYHSSHTRYQTLDQLDSRGVGRPKLHHLCSHCVSICPVIGAVAIGYGPPWPSHAVLTASANEIVLIGEQHDPQIPWRIVKTSSHVENHS